MLAYTSLETSNWEDFFARKAENLNQPTNFKNKNSKPIEDNGFDVFSDDLDDFEDF